MLNDKRWVKSLSAFLREYKLVGVRSRRQTLIYCGLKKKDYSARSKAVRRSLNPDV